MKTQFILLLCSLACVSLSAQASAQTDADISSVDTGLIIPQEIDWTERFIITEQKELRVDLEKMRREMMTEIQNKELTLIDRALSYSANTLNFFFIFLSIMLMGLGVVGWKSISDAKKSIKDGMEGEIEKVVSLFQKKIDKLERQQKVNILWRHFYSSENDAEQLDILKNIEEISPSSDTLHIERSNVYIRMESYDQVIELCTTILNKNFDTPQALYNRACAYAALGDHEKAEEDLFHLMKISPEYQSMIDEEPILKKRKKKSK